ncbi:hypothetical protein F0U59_10300 [Archangium gephyra]|nr:hypothetical protein F0U59_10300 [Archangium gephyra]
MLIFLRNKSDTNDVITQPESQAVLPNYTTRFPKITETDQRAVPWYTFDEDPVAFGTRLLEFAKDDVVCQALLARASDQWGLDFSLDSGRFKNKYVQEHYTKLLRNWLSPLSGNLKRRTAHLTDIDTQISKVWSQLDGIDGVKVKQIAALDFFKAGGFSVAGRRDRLQLYRSFTEAARALVGEVTSWHSRYIEKLTVLSLMRSPKLAALQRQMLKEALPKRNTFKCEMWEYLPYYLRGVALEKCEDDFARPRVLGALHDCLNDDAATQSSADQSIILAFKQLDGGREYTRWRKLPAVVRYQVMISDLARILPGGKDTFKHQRLEFESVKLSGLPNLGGFSGWSTTMKEHSSAIPHDPGIHNGFATGWIRNEFCPNVVSSRLLLAPLYAGTSGHNQGRILAWRKITALDSLPVGLIISAGYSVLWRLYYDKRVSGFHTMFETLQGTHGDSLDTVSVSTFKGGTPDDELWDLLVENSSQGKTNVSKYWTKCIESFAKKGPMCHIQLKQALIAEREVLLGQMPDTALLRWSDTSDSSQTAPDVGAWSKGTLDTARERMEKLSDEVFIETLFD